MTERPYEGKALTVYPKETKAPKAIFGSKKETLIPEKILDNVVIYRDNPFDAPGQLLREGEGILRERSRLRQSAVFKSGEGVPYGYGETVILNCGFLVGDYSLGTLAAWLGRKGYNSLHLATAMHIEPMAARVEKLYRLIKNSEKNGSKIKLIGQSLGGYEDIMAVAIHPELSEDVDEIITLGSPTNFPLKLNAIVYDAYFLNQIWFGNSDLNLPREILKSGGWEALNRVRITSVLAKKDGIVSGVGDWRGFAHQEYVINTTHCGLGFNQETYQIIGHILSAGKRVKAA